jgi:hypothetical protein
MQVIRAAQEAVRLSFSAWCFCLTIPHQGVDRHIELRSMNDTELLSFVNSKMWNP